jgi:hypothetical protein
MATLLFMSGEPHQGRRIAQVLGGAMGDTAIVTARFITQAMHVMRSRPPHLMILDMTWPCEIDPEFVIARFMPMARGAPPLLIFTSQGEFDGLKHYGGIPGVFVTPFPTTDLILRAVIKEHLL